MPLAYTDLCALKEVKHNRWRQQRQRTDYVQF